MASIIEDYTITRFDFKRDRVIGDAQVYIDQHHVGVLEISTSTGYTGTGFFLSLFHPLPALDELERIFEAETFPSLRGQNPFALINRVSRPRGGNRRGSVYFDQAVNQALWDLQGKETGLPLYRLLGGKNNKVPVYASGLDFHLSDDDFTRFFQQASAMGYKAFKIKVGHPDLEWDLARLERLKAIIPPDAKIMVDANESWSPKEALRRMHAYHDAGTNIYWVEDPCLRDDFDGLATLVAEFPYSHINSGEYLDLSGKRRLIEHQAVDILNIHGQINDSLKAAWLAAEHGIPVSIGNTMLEIGVHLAAALPEVLGLEYSFQNYNHLVKQPIRIEDGFAYAPDLPGHGLELSDEARKIFARPTPLSPGALDEEPAPPSPIKL